MFYYTYTLHRYFYCSLIIFRDTITYGFDTSRVQLCFIYAIYYKFKQYAQILIDEKAKNKFTENID